MYPPQPTLRSWFQYTDIQMRCQLRPPAGMYQLEAVVSGYSALFYRIVGGSGRADSVPVELTAAFTRAMLPINEVAPTKKRTE